MYCAPMPDEKHLSMHPHRYPDIPGIVFLVIRMREVQAVHFRTRKLPEGMSLQDMQREAERCAIEHWDGLIMMQLALPIGDCGHAPADL